jgi:hypothetical protein
LNKSKLEGERNLMHARAAACNDGENVILTMLDRRRAAHSLHRAHRFML